MDDKYIRQQELVNQEKLAGLNVTIVGCGAVGSFTALSLAKMGVGQLTLIDDDKVSVENLPNQFYRDCDLGKKKVDACSDLIRQFDRQISMITLARPFIKQKLEANVVIAAVDSMEVRKKIWTAVNNQRSVQLLIDPRMAAKVIQVLGDPSSSKKYEQTLVDDSATLDERCTAKSIIYSVLPLAGLICRQVASFINDEWLEPAVTLDLKTLSLLREGINV